MATIRALKDASILDAPKAKPKVPSTAALARAAEYERLRAMVKKITEPGHVYEVILEPGEKALTVRQRLRTVAAESGKEIVVRSQGKGLAAGQIARRSR
jgi:hypothetical protein